MAIQYVDEIAASDVTGKRIIARFDFNVPLKGEEITDTTRIDEALPTIELLLSKKPLKLILMGHLGRPKGKVNAAFSLRPVASYLAEKLNAEVILTETPAGKGNKALINLPEAKIVMLENIRFDAREEENSKEFAGILASYGDLYVNDAFGCAHRKHASTHNIISYFKNKSYAGLLMKKEVETLTKLIERPAKPLVAIIGGAKVSDKIKTLEQLLPHVDHLLVGGAMSYPFLKVKGIDVGRSRCSDEDVSLARHILSGPSARKIELPIDHLASDSLEGKAQVIHTQEVPSELMALDIGPQTEEKFALLIKKSKTVFWNGPMGLFENPEFSHGTLAIAQSVSEVDGVSIVGGGDSVSAVKQTGLAHKMTLVSTGGGATLEFIEQGSLPCVQALKFGV